MGYTTRVRYLCLLFKKKKKKKERSLIVSKLLFCTFNQPQVRVCVPLPMYHIFCSVTGGLMMGVHGVTLVYPSSTYSSKANLESIQNERYTVYLNEFESHLVITLWLSHCQLFIVPQGAISCMALLQCLLICSANQIYTNMMCHHSSLVRGTTASPLEYGVVVQHLGMWIYWLLFRDRFWCSVSP